MATLTYSSLPREIKNIATQSLGSGVLKSLFNYSYVYHMIIKTNGDKFVGFSLYHFENEGNGNRAKIIGVVDAICVDTESRNQGFGTLLTFGVLRKLSTSGANRIELVAKIPQKEKVYKRRKSFQKRVDEFLNGMGFEKELVYDNHYRNISMKYSYKCVMCEENPDSCHGILYSIVDDGSDIIIDRR